MNQDNPLLLLGLMSVSFVIARWWWQDFSAARSGSPAGKPLPGATVVSWLAVWLAVAGTLLLLAAETMGEARLKIAAEQSRITWLFGTYTLFAAFIEELIFRGFVVADRGSRGALIASIFLASTLFAALHPFLWDWKDHGLELHFSPKAWFSTAAVFAGSLWFYLVRFWRLNPTRSLWPCIAAHLAKNLGVLVIKHAQGFVSGWW